MYDRLPTEREYQALLVWRDFLLVLDLALTLSKVSEAYTFAVMVLLGAVAAPSAAQTFLNVVVAECAAVLQLPS